jgi:putative pyruvate formate lyase activating enzyme
VHVCPKLCGNDRLNDEIAACYSGRLPIVSSYTAHFGEEPCLSGTNGAGNIFFGNCNLRCVYCQNYQISQTWKTQKRNEVTHERLAEMILSCRIADVITSDSSRRRISPRRWRERS